MLFRSSGTNKEYNSPRTCDQNPLLNKCKENNKLTVKTYLQGFYSGNGHMRNTLFDLGMSLDSTATDSVNINLWRVSNLSSSVPSYSYRTLLHNDGNINIDLPESSCGENYYIAVNHRNSIETWSATTVKIRDSISYDFTNSLNKAFSDGFNNPMIEVENGVYALYSGDVNQDGTSDIIDMTFTENDALDFEFGYIKTDCNGDGGSDLLDMQIIENNASMYLFTARPY